MKLPRLLNPLTAPAAYLAAISAVYAVAVMIYNISQHHGVLDTGVIWAAITALGALGVHTQVTPVRDPRGADGTPLGPASPPADLGK